MKNRFKILSQREKKKKIEIGQETSYYSALINGWINTRIESDKSILTLSVSAIGLLFTLLMTIKITDVFIQILFLLAILSFLFCTIITIKVFDKNADLLQSIANNTNISENDKKLKRMDSLKNILFFSGLGIALLLSAILVIKKTSEEEMAKKQTPTQIIKTTKVPAKKSLQGFQNMKPSGSSTQSGGGSKKTGKK